MGNGFMFLWLLRESVHVCTQNCSIHIPSQSRTQFILDPELADAINVSRIAVYDENECH